MTADGVARPGRRVSDPESADPGLLERHVRRLEGPRHPDASPRGHARAARYVADELEGAGWTVRSGPGPGQDAGGPENVSATAESVPDSAPRVLVGAHYDTVPGTPGADDNASGVAALLEVARLLTPDPRRPVELVAFDMEEPRGGTYRIGSRRWVEGARRRGVPYAAALVMEMVGYTDSSEGSQRVPWLLRWEGIPRRGTFLAAVGDWGSGALLREFERAARRAAPDLEVITTRIPFRGWPVPQSRLSDNASFWDAGIPALMLTDTAFLRNPHYHGAGDRAETLDYRFMARTASAVAATAEELAPAR